jgi:hypothetical protein
MIEGEVVGRKSSAQAKRDGDWEAIKAELDACDSLEKLNLRIASPDLQAAAKRLPPKWVQQLNDYVEDARDWFAKNDTAPIPPQSNLDAIEEGALT